VVWAGVVVPREKRIVRGARPGALGEGGEAGAGPRAGVKSEDVGALFFVSTTGISTPSLDAKLLFRLGLSPNLRRIPVWGLGCAGGAAGVARA
jgi:predicted naringenin-chalcone synthase